MLMPTNHRPLPWIYDRDNQEIITGDETKRIAEYVRAGDAALIVRAVNAHAELVSALGMAASEMEVAAGVAWTKADAVENLHMPAARGLRNSGDKLKYAAQEIRAALARANGQ